MEYISCTEAAKLWGITNRRIQQLCKDGAIEGAVREGRVWLIPAGTVCPSPHVDKQVHSGRIKKKPLPIGISDYKKATTDYYYVDKTLLIKDFLDNRAEVTLFTRPRRFGKTLNMDMFRVFFEISDSDTSVYFRDKQIWQCGQDYTSFQGKFPVIYLSFKDVKCDSWEETLGILEKLITLEFLRHSELEGSNRITAYEKEIYDKLAGEKADENDYRLSLQYLSLMLHKHYGQKVIIIIDEYDTPIQQGHSCGFYEQVISFMRVFFSGGLKDGAHLAYGFMTGILRVAKESIFSGLNNIKICSVLDNDYSQYFGFTEDEVEEMLAYYGAPDKMGEVREWYDGYRFGNAGIFNPWSVVNYIAGKCEPAAFWQATGNNSFIGEILGSASPDIMKDLQHLLSGGTVNTYIDTNVIYPDIKKNPYSIYSFLLVAGYLKIEAKYPQTSAGRIYGVSIPNKEISFVYEKEIIDKFNCNEIALSVEEALISGEAEKLQAFLEKFLLDSISFYDTANEGFYHGLLLGLCSILSGRYKIYSNRESGLGRFDIQLTPKTKTYPGFILELKQTKDGADNLDNLAGEALRQIENLKYSEQMKQDGITDIVKIGIAFHGKRVAVQRG